MILNVPWPSLRNILLPRRNACHDRTAKRLNASMNSSAWAGAFPGRIKAPWLASLLALLSFLRPTPVLGADAAGIQRDLSLVDLRRLVLEQNEQIQARLYESEASERIARGERGIFEPALVVGADYQDTLRPNNRQQTAQLGFFARPTFAERNTLYNAGLEFLLGTGAKVRTGYALRELNNNIGAPETNSLRLMGRQYETFVGISATQPLLKGAGIDATTAKIRLAAIASSVALQEYRRQVFLALASAEASYWDLRLAQEQATITADSVGTATRVLADNEARLDVGKGSALDVVQAQAAVASRKARLAQARQTAFDYASRLSSLYSQFTGADTALPRAVDSPEMTEPAPDAMASYQMAFEKNPDYLIRRQQVDQEKLRVSYLRNQRLPQLDLKGSFGLNGLSQTPDGSLSDMARQDYPAWSLGVELRVPLGGGIKEKNDLEAGRLGKIRALTSLKEAEVQMLNSIDGARRKIDLHRSSLTNARSVVDFHEKLLKAQLDRLAVGAIDSRAVLETEEKLLEARIAIIESMVMERKSWVELEVVRGSFLQARSAEIDVLALRALGRQRLAEGLDSKPHKPALNPPQGSTRN